MLAPPITPVATGTNDVWTYDFMFNRNATGRRSDNGSEFIAEIIKEFLAENNTKATYIEPGNPRQNGKDESLRMEIFGNRSEAVVVAEQWRNFYNGERPHSSLGYQTPDEFKNVVSDNLTSFMDTNYFEEWLATALS